MRSPVRRPPARRLVTLLLASCVAAAIAAPVAVAQSVPGGLEVTAGSRYLALGDSVTFGYQEPSVVPAPDYSDAASFLGYPEQLSAELHLKLANAACPGETSASLINTSALNLGCESVFRRHLHVSYKGSQLAYAVKFLRQHHDVRLVSLMIGANDAIFCQVSTKDGCASPSEESPVLARIAANTRRILSAIRNQAHYHGQLALVSYYSLNYASAFVTSTTIKLNHALDSSAERFHAVIANGFAEFRAAAVHSGGDTCAAGLLTQLGSPGKCGIHPSYAGQALLAQALEKAIRL